jgi:hypothetical protein
MVAQVPINGGDGKGVTAGHIYLTLLIDTLLSPRLADLSQQYQRSTWKKVKFDVVHGVPTSTPGRYLHGIVEDPTDNIEGKGLALLQNLTSNQSFVSQSVFASSSVTMRRPMANTPKGGYFNSIAPSDSLRLSSPGKYLLVAEQDIPASVTGSLTVWIDYEVDLHVPTHETDSAATFVLPYDIYGANSTSGIGPTKQVGRPTNWFVDPTAEIPLFLREQKYSYKYGFWRRVEGTVPVSVYHANVNNGDYGSVTAHSTLNTAGFAILANAPPGYNEPWNGTTWSYKKNNDIEANGVRLVNTMGFLIPGRQDAKQYTHFHQPPFVSDPDTDEDIIMPIVPLFSAGDVFEFVEVAPGDLPDGEDTKNVSLAHTSGLRSNSSQGIARLANGSLMSERLLTKSRNLSAVTYRASWMF